MIGIVRRGNDDAGGEIFVVHQPSDAGSGDNPRRNRLNAADAQALRNAARNFGTGLAAGIGLKPEDAARLFEEFARVKNEKTRHILGSGLGLSIVRKLAMLYGGDAAVTSEENVGSTFTVVLNDAVTQ